MSNSTRIVPILLTLSLIGLSGCAAPHSQFVLLPSPDGHIGKVTVASKSGQTTLAKAFESTGLSRSEDKPSAPVVITEADVNATFGEALSAAPIAPVTYLLYFEPASSKLTQESEKLLPQIMEYIRKTASTYISISGHSDRVGSRDVNVRVSRDRANAVAELLKGMGVPPESLEVASHGMELPLIDTPEGVPEPRNRRVEIVVR